MMHAASLMDTPSDLHCLTGDEKSDGPDDDDDTQSDEDQEIDSQSDNQNHIATVPIANGHYLAMVPGNRRPIDPALAAQFDKLAPPPPVAEPVTESQQLRRLERHQEQLREIQERQKRQWLEEQRVRVEQQHQLEKQRRELLQLQQQMRRSPPGVMLSPSSGLCTIYEAMETSEEEEEEEGKEDRGEQNRSTQKGPEGERVPSSQTARQDFHSQLRPVPPQDLDWNKKVDMVQQLINQTLLLSGDRGCPPLLLFPVGTGGTLSPLESSMWPRLLAQFSPPSATVTSVSSYSPDSQGSSPPGDWTVVEVETQH